MTGKSKRVFSVAPVTAPTAGEAVNGAAKTSVRPGIQTSKGDRIAFTWRLTPDQADQLDTLVLDLRRQLGRGRLDRAAVLQVLVDLATDREGIRTDIAKRLGA